MTGKEMTPRVRAELNACIQALEVIQSKSNDELIRRICSKRIKALKELDKSGSSGWGLGEFKEMLELSSRGTALL